jgi:hypothetical protein
VAIWLTARDSIDYYALKREFLRFFYIICEKLALSEKLQASRLNSMPTFQAKSGAGRLKKEITADAA